MMKAAQRIHVASSANHPSSANLNGDVEFRDDVSVATST
jgi:hypothetical protein